MANPQTENGYIRIANEIWDEVIRRDFSKRQKDILLFIWRLSYGCQRRSAYVPKMKDFELSGVPATQIKTELEYLERSRVLFWNREEKLFEINKDYEKWYVNLVKSWNDERFTELLAINIKHKKSSQNMNDNFMKHEDEENENFTKHEVETSQNMNIDFMKHEDQGGSIPCGSKAKSVSKDIIKDIIKNSSSTKLIELNQDTERGGNHSSEFSHSRIYQIYEKHFASDGRVTEFEVEDLGALFDQYGGEWVYEAMREAARHKVLTIAYVNAVLKGFEKRGGPHKEEPKQVVGGQPIFQVPDDSITRMLREVNQVNVANGVP